MGAKHMRSTIRDVAALANVSVGTVSMVLNGSDKITEQTAKKVMDAVAKVNYRRNPHARSLSSSRSYTIGLAMTDLTNPFFGMMVGHLQREIDRHGYSLILGMTKNSVEQEKKLIEKFLDAGVDGVLIVPAHERNPELSHIYQLISHRMPFAYVSTYYTGTKGSCVMTDLAKGSYDLTKYLLDMNHKNIAFISGYRELVLSDQRIKGFIRAHRDRGIEIRYDQILETEPDFQSGYDAARRVFERFRPDAIMTINDVMSMGVMAYLHEINMRVPEDISVAGYDDLLFSSMLETPLTTVRQPIKEMCRQAVDMLFGAIEEDDGCRAEAKRVLLEPELMIRKSTTLR